MKNAKFKADRTTNSNLVHLEDLNSGMYLYFKIYCYAEPVQKPYNFPLYLVLNYFVALGKDTCSLSISMEFRLFAKFSPIPGLRLYVDKCNKDLKTITHSSFSGSYKIWPCSAGFPFCLQLQT